MINNINYSELFWRELGDTVSNLIFYGIGILAIGFIKNYLDWDILGWILFICFSILVLVEIIRYLINLSSFIKMWNSNTKDRKHFIGLSSVWLIENSIFVFYFFYLLKFFK